LVVQHFAQMYDPHISRPPSFLSKFG